ncbi:MAG: zinc ribbon domain-containing protein [Calditrichaeota bacterium]|nr:zinc ribbon domain-containing protein [Calditrichota bacterium]RQW07799.1 MAG: zinc ribbon domain-containing protein [Calditrichota bacterium]
MPTYRYICEQCGYELEEFSSISSYHQEIECPVCQGIARLTISGGSGIIFKGSGFYITDYQKKSDKGNGHTDKK